MMNYDGHFFGGGIMWIIWILIAMGVFFIIQNVVKGNTRSSYSNETPLEILKKRYARGEIEEEEYESRRKELEK